MVQRLPYHNAEKNFQQGRDEWPPKYPDRFMGGNAPLDQGVFSPPRPASAIENAVALLRDQTTQNPVDYALIVSQGGQTRSFTSESLFHVESRLFSPQFKEEFEHGIRNLPRPGGQDPNEKFSQYELNDRRDDRRQSYSSDSSARSRQRPYGRQLRDDFDSDESALVARKRPREWNRCTEIGEHDTPGPIQVSNTRLLRIGDSDAVAAHYALRLKDMQQTSCKTLAKSFVKAVEPKKQTNHPYTGGAKRAPPWWPLPKPGEKSLTGVRHKEPDHLLKPERIALCVHIIRIATDPNKPANLKHVTIHLLEKVSKEALNPFFNDSKHPSNASKRPYFKEIFKVAREEARFRDGCLDASTAIKVMHGDGPVVTDDEPDEGVKYEDDDDEETQGMPTPPEDMVSPHAGHGQNAMPTRPVDHDYNLPMRFIPTMEERSYQDTTMQNTSMQQQQPFLSNGYQHPTGVQEQDRRSGWTAGFSSPQNPYSSWSPPNNMVVTSSIGFPPFTSTLPPPNTSYLPNLPPPGAAQQMRPVQSQSFGNDGLMGRPYESGQVNHSLRTGSLGHPHQLPQSQGYQDYLHDNSFSQSAVDHDMKEEHHQHLQH